MVLKSNLGSMTPELMFLDTIWRSEAAVINFLGISAFFLAILCLLLNVCHIYMLESSLEPRNMVYNLFSTFEYTRINGNLPERSVETSTNRKSAQQSSDTEWKIKKKLTA